MQFKVAPVILPFAFPEEVTAGQMLQALCSVTSGDDPLTLRWFKDDIPLTSSPEFMVTNMNSKMSLLVLQGVDSIHTGKYTCVATNPVGESTFSAQLNVNGNLIIIYTQIL